MSLLPPLNPVLAREVKERLRTRRATIVLTIYLAVLSLLLYVIYAAATDMANNNMGDPMASQAALLGRVMFETILLVMLGLVLFIVPGLTADAVTGERERQTLVPLQVSLLRPRSILAGKLLASVAFTALLVVATLPLFGISFIVGGVSVGQVLKGVVAVLAVAFVSGSITLWCSSLVRRTQAAIVLAYFMMFVLVAGSFAVYGMQMVFESRQNDVARFDEPGQFDQPFRDPRPSTAVLHLNPFLATADFVAVPGDGIDAPLQGIADFIRRQEGREDDMMMGEFDGGGFVDEGFDQPMPMPVSPVPADENGVPLPIDPNGGAVTTTVEPPPEDGEALAAVEEEALATAEADGQEVVDGRLLAAADDDDDGFTVPFWLRSTLLLGALSAGAFALAARRIRTPSDRTAM